MNENNIENDYATVKLLAALVILGWLAGSTTGCSGPLGVAIGEEAIAAKVRLAEIEADSAAKRTQLRRVK